jgi:hypothetical protein
MGSIGTEPTTFRAAEKFLHFRAADSFTISSRQRGPVVVVTQSSAGKCGIVSHT